MNYKKIVIILIVALIILLVIGFLILVFSEYKPKKKEILDVEGDSSKELELDKSIRIITYNLGYLSLDSSQDFFMDGGKGVMPKDSSNVKTNLTGMKDFIENQDSDIYLFQEVDINAKRSYHINEYEGLKEDFEGTSTFAYMFKSLYIPYPFFNPVGHVESGNVTLNKYPVTSATRIALPSSFTFPKRVVMYKNPILEERIKINETTRELIVYNVHLDAYGSSGGKGKQFEVLLENMKEEVEKGNYVIAGGDFNQIFPDTDLTKFPLMDISHFSPTKLNHDDIPDGWKFVTDYTKPTSRLLNEVYSGTYEDTQLYIIDGFIVGPNIEIMNVEVIENNFLYSDHQPVKLEMKLHSVE